MKRGTILLWVVLLLILMLICTCHHAKKIEQQLHDEAVSAVAAASIAGQDLNFTMDGRRLTLTGTVGSPEIKNRVYELVSAVTGIRGVDDQLGLASAVASSAVARPAVVEKVTGAVEAITGLNDVTLHGRVPDATVKSGLIETAGEIWGVERVIDELEIDPSVTLAGDLRGLLRLLGDQIDGVGFAADGETITLQGAVPSAQIKERLVKASENLFAGVAIRNLLRVEVREAAAVQANLEQILTNGVVRFENNSDVLTAEGRRVLDRITAQLRGTGSQAIEVAGYTDSRGDNAYNLDLSRRRAASAAAYLAGRDLDRQRFQAEGYGEADPVADNETAAGRALNRRIEFRLLAGSQP